MNTIENSRTAVLPGDGRVHRGPGAAVVLPHLTTEQVPQARAILAACARLADDRSGRTTVLAVAEVVTRGPRPGLPAFGLALDTDLGLVVMLHDRAAAEIHRPGEEVTRLRGTDSLAWVERRFTGRVDSFGLWTGSHQTYPGTGSAVMEGISLNLSRGTLPGSGVFLTNGEEGSAEGSLAGSVEQDLLVTAERRVEIARTSEQPVPPPYSPSAPTTYARVPYALPAHAGAQTEEEEPEPATEPLAQPSGSAEHVEPEPVEPVEQVEQAGPAHGDDAGTADDDRSYGSQLPSTPHLGQAQLPIQAHLQPFAETAAVQQPRKPLPPQPLRTPGGGVSVPRPNVPPIEGVLCARGHFTDPKATFCAICGLSMQQVTRRITWRPRPTLGVLVLDDGTSVTVDHDLIIGRDPTAHPAVVAGDAKPMYLNDDLNGVSRVHARITLVDWSVCLTDEESANGTFLMDANGTHAVHGEDAVELAGGSVIRIGRRTLTFDGYHSAGE